jgi:hypothetical protein
MAPSQKYSTKKKAPAEPAPPSKRQRRRVAENANLADGSEDEDEEPVPAALQRKIATEARLQQDEMDMTRAHASGPGMRAPTSAVDSDDDGALDGEGSADEDGDDDELAGAGEFFEDVEELELGEEDRRVLDVLVDGGAPTRTLADVIMAKINERAAAVDGGADGGGPPADGDLVPDLPPKVLEVYTSVGKVLSTCALTTCAATATASVLLLHWSSGSRRRLA